MGPGPQHHLTPEPHWSALQGDGQIPALLEPSDRRPGRVQQRSEVLEILDDGLCPVKWCNSATDVLALVYATGTSRLSWSAASAGRKSACIDSALT